MRPTDIQQVGEELAIKWDDGSENFVRLETLRRCCPCAGCKGEVDVMGKVYRNPDRPLPPAAFELRRITTQEPTSSTGAKCRAMKLFTEAPRSSGSAR